MLDRLEVFGEGAEKVGSDGIREGYLWGSYFRIIGNKEIVWQKNSLNRMVRTL